METEPASAKVNLCLHVTGRRADGYHDLDSLVVFAGIGDQIRVQADANLSLTLTGPMASGLGGLDPQDNLVMRAARLFGGARGALLTLDKQLPPASGIGGGSADAAATLRLLARHWRVALPDAASVLGLGADVPVCLVGRPCRMQGIGERVRPLPAVARLWLVLVNPGVAVATPAVFGALKSAKNPPLPARLPDLSAPDGLIRFLGLTRNDLQPAALSVAPVIQLCLDALSATKGCAFARMSGSGATCFGLYRDEPTARAAAKALIAQSPPQWWVAAAPILD